uniref:LVIVD repeat protein n=1 Tax=candidate division WOR-3 bacterium TaxID=2052148 RepID=A0A7V1EHE1_UNCW3
MKEKIFFIILLISSIVQTQTLEEIERNSNSIQISGSGFFDCKPLAKLKIDYSNSISFDSLRHLIFCGSDNKVYIIDVSNPINPYKIPVEIHTKGTIEKLFYDYKTQTLYIAELEQGIEIWSIKTPSDIENIGRYITSDRAMSVYVSGSYAYVADWDAGLRIVNILNPANPIEVGYYNSPGYCCDIYVLDSYAYIADWDEGIRIIDILNPSSPREVGFYNTPGYCWNICVKDSYAYVADDYAGLRVINISNPSTPYEMGCCDIDGFVDKVIVADPYLFVLNSLKGLLMFNNFNLSKIYGRYCYEGSILDFYVAYGYIFLTEGNNLMIYNFRGEK